MRSISKKFNEVANAGTKTHRDGKAEMRKDCKKIRHPPENASSIPTCATFGLDDELCRGIVRRGPATTTNCLLKSYMKDSHAPRAHKMLHNACVMPHDILRHLRDVGRDTSETDRLGDLGNEGAEDVAS